MSEESEWPIGVGKGEENSSGKGEECSSDFLILALRDPFGTFDIQNYKIINVCRKKKKHETYFIKIKYYGLQKITARKCLGKSQTWKTCL